MYYVNVSSDNRHGISVWGLVTTVLLCVLIVSAAVSRPVVFRARPLLSINILLSFLLQLTGYVVGLRGGMRWMFILVNIFGVDVFLFISICLSMQQKVNNNNMIDHIDINRRILTILVLYFVLLCYAFYTSSVLLNSQSFSYDISMLLGGFFWDALSFYAVIKGLEKYQSIQVSNQSLSSAEQLASLERLFSSSLPPLVCYTLRGICIFLLCAMDGQHIEYSNWWWSVSTWIPVSVSTCYLGVYMFYNTGQSETNDGIDFPSLFCRGSEPAVERNRPSGDAFRNLNECFREEAKMSKATTENSLAEPLLERV